MSRFVSLHMILFRLRCCVKSAELVKLGRVSTGCVSAEVVLICIRDVFLACVSGMLPWWSVWLQLGRRPPVSCWNCGGEVEKVK